MDRIVLVESDMFHVICDDVFVSPLWYNFSR